MTFTLIQAWRAALCVGVVLAHIKIYLLRSGDPSLFAYLPDILGGIPCAFFAVSGYFMATLVDRDTKNFLVLRLLRVYPMYILAILLAYALRALTATPLDYDDLPEVLSLLPFGGRKSYKLGIEWTLIYEIFFYFICTIFCRPSLSRKFPAFLMIWLSAVLLASALHPILNHLPNMAAIGLSGWNYGFIAGALAYYFLKSYHDPQTQAWAKYALLATVCTFSALHPKPVSVIIMLGMLACFALIALVMLESKIQAPTLLTNLGDYSYSLYLIHASIIILVFDRWKAFTGESPGFIAGMVSLVLCLSGFWYLGQLDVSIHKRLKFAVQKKLSPQKSSGTADPIVQPAQ